MVQLVGRLPPAGVVTPGSRAQVACSAGSPLPPLPHAAALLVLMHALSNT